MFVDTHAHLYVEQFDKDRAEVVQNAVNMGVLKIFLPNIDSKTTHSMLQMATDFPKTCYPMIGLHPCSVKDDYKNELSHIEEQLQKHKFFGIGETGIDLYWDKSHIEEQVIAFENQIQLAKDTKLPIIIHSRESLDMTIELIEKHQDGSLSGVFHCFNGDRDQCNRIQDVGFYMGLGGVTTFKNANMKDVVQHMNEDHMVLETDAPYLSPVPNRGKRNISAYIPLIAAKVAEFRNTEIRHIRDLTTTNAQKLFGF